ncbi:MAG: hypothetical protein AABY22_11625 [Nanoarchaeota archaeon]
MVEPIKKKLRQLIHIQCKICKEYKPMAEFCCDEYTIGEVCEDCRADYPGDECEYLENLYDKLQKNESMIEQYSNE